MSGWGGVRVRAKIHCFQMHEWKTTIMGSKMPPSSQLPMLVARLVTECTSTVLQLFPSPAWRCCRSGASQDLLSAKQRCSATEHAPKASTGRNRPFSLPQGKAGRQAADTLDQASQAPEATKEAQVRGGRPQFVT